VIRRALCWFLGHRTDKVEFVGEISTKNLSFVLVCLRCGRSQSGYLVNSKRGWDRVLDRWKEPNP
jgi:hypothetical protein